MMGIRHKLIPIFADVITPDATITKLIEEQRAPFKDALEEVIGTTDTLLYRRGNFNGTWDDLICDALINEREADIAMSPGVRWGPSHPAGTRDHPRRHLERHLDELWRGVSHRNDRRIPANVLEDVADNLFNQIPITNRAATWCASVAWLPHRRQQTAGRTDHRYDAVENRRSD